MGSCTYWGGMPRRGGCRLWAQAVGMCCGYELGYENSPYLRVWVWAVSMRTTPAGEARRREVGVDCGCGYGLRVYLYALWVWVPALGTTGSCTCWGDTLPRGGEELWLWVWDVGMNCGYGICG